MSKAGVDLPFYALATPIPRNGDVVLARVREVNPAYPILEEGNGKGVVLQGGELIAGVLGARKALRGFSGRLPARLQKGMPLHLLNKGGVIGECTAFNRELGWPTQLEYIGNVYREGHSLNLDENALPFIEGPLPEIPVIMVMGTCMNAGKTSVCKQIVKLFAEKGFTVNAGKVAGVACLQDTIAMQECGAKKVASFLDFGLSSTTEIPTLSPVARSLIHHLADPEPDFIVLEMGDGILGGYNVASLFDDNDFMSRSLCTILCANDLMGVWGSLQWMAQHGKVQQAQRPHLISGPVTDSSEGIEYIEENWRIPAANAFDSSGKICTIVLESLMPWLELE